MFGNFTENTVKDNDTKDSTTISKDQSSRI